MMMQTLPLAIIMPHGGLEVPPEVAGRIALNESQRFNEADAYVDMIYDFRERVHHWVSFPFARAIIDVNRSTDPARNRPGDGVVKLCTSYGAPVYLPGKEPDLLLTNRLVDRYWRSWHRHLAAIAEDKRVKLVIDAHSMAAVGPSHYDDPEMLRPRIAVSNLGDRQAQPHPRRKRLSAGPAVTLAMARELGWAFEDIPAYQGVGDSAAINNPFSGGCDLWQHGGRHQPWVMIEVNRALYVAGQTDESGVLPANADRIALLRERMWQALVRICEQLPDLPD